MAITINKQLAVSEDISWGLGTVTQARDIDASGVPTDTEYNQVNASHVPTTDGDVQADIDDRYTKTEVDGTFVLIDNVLVKEQVVVYSPTELYHPATKKYVDDTVIAIGTADMAKAIYDNSGLAGVVDNSEALGGIASDDALLKRATVTDCDSATVTGFYSGVDVANSPVTGAITLVVLKGDTNTVQTIYHGGTNKSYKRDYTSTWSVWMLQVGSNSIVNSLAGDVDVTTVLGSYQGKILDDKKLEKTVTYTDGNVPIYSTVNATAALVDSGKTVEQLANIVYDTTPQLGGDLDCNGKVFKSSNYLQMSDLAVASGTYTYDFSGGDHQEIAVTGDFTLAFSNFVTNRVCIATLDVVNGGAWTITYPAGTLFKGGTKPTLTASGMDKLLIIKDGTDVYTILSAGIDLKVGV